MLVKEQIEARFELDLLEPYERLIQGTGRSLTLPIIADLWLNYLKLCYETKEINKHQFDTWVLPKKYINKINNK